MIKHVLKVIGYLMLRFRLIPHEGEIIVEEKYDNCTSYKSERPSPFFSMKRMYVLNTCTKIGLVLTEFTVQTLHAPVCSDSLCHNVFLWWLFTLECAATMNHNGSETRPRRHGKHRAHLVWVGA